MKRFVVVFFSSLLTVAYGWDVSVIAACRTLRGTEREQCLSGRNERASQKRYPLLKNDASSSSSIIRSYPDQFRLKIDADRTLIPEGASCIRFTDERRARCRVIQLQRDIRAGRRRSSSSSSVSANMRIHCARLSAAEKRDCLLDARNRIPAANKSLR